MTSWKWVSSTIKNLKLGGTSTMGPAAQSRLFSAVPVAGVPPKPKRPLTPYFRFLNQVRDGMKKENPTLKQTELMRKCAQGWDKLDEPSKNEYTLAYKKEMESYTTILQKYQKSLSPEQKELGQQLKLEKQMKKEKRDKRKRTKELGRPKKPTSSFLNFLKSKVPTGSNITEYQAAAKDAAAKWKTMSENEKKQYTDKYLEELKSYEKDLLKWEEKMIKQGNSDVVRQSTLNKSQKTKST